MKTIIKTGMAIIAMTSFWACSSSEKNDIDPEQPNEEKTDEELVILAEPEYISTMSLVGNDAAINNGINKFSFEFFNKVAQGSANEQIDGENITVSPLGAALCLGLQANALDDSGTAQLVEMFGAKSLEEYNTYCQKLMRFLPYDRWKSSELILANSAWLSNKYTFNQTFENDLNNYFNAEVYNVDFSSSASQTNMDLWCSKKTKGTINESPIKIDSSNYYVLLNAMYFNANWDEPFAAKNTKNADFYGTKGTQTVSMMHNTFNAQYASTDTYQAVQVPYQNTNYDMVIVLPGEGVDVVDLSKSFNEKDLNEALDASTYEVSLSLPKFAIEQSRDLTSTLYKLGYPTNATLKKAGIVGLSNPTIRQNTFTTVNEEGTIVAAITGIGEMTMGLSGESLPKVEVNVNRPFLFFVRNNVTGTILMAGRVCNI
jgi:serpin B